MSPFVDTNILVYAFSNDARRSRAVETINAGVVVSVQVLNEFADVTLRKYRWDRRKVAMILSEIDDLVESVLPLTVEAQAFGVHISERHQFRIYDACIIASASLAGCKTLYTEDMTDGAVVAGVTIINPFKDKAPAGA
jgi:predicted nucleic acid-binding protein